jgi:Mlc titration factor MtfA (ptsG expression regulator)
VSLIRRWRDWRTRRVLERRAVSDALWDATLRRFPFIAQRDEGELARLREMVSLFLDQKEFTGAGGFEVADDVAVAVAAQACLPVLNLGLEHYAGFVGIVMHADEVVAQREITDDDTGLVHAYDEVLSGEAMDGGPLMLSWTDASGERESPWGYNVVIHEFAHVLDLGNGEADGMPLLPTPAEQRRWMQVMQVEFDHFQERVVCGHEDEGVIDPYGAEAIDEFFAVASESFFVTPQLLLQERPALYALLAGYYRQDPAAS